MEVSMKQVKELRADLEHIRHPPTLVPMGNMSIAETALHHANNMARALESAAHCGLLDAQTMTNNAADLARAQCREALANFRKALGG